MSDERIEINQPFQLIIVCEVDGEIYDLQNTTAQAIEYRSPDGIENKVTAQILNPPGTDGKIYYNVPKDIFNKINNWLAKPWLTLIGGDEIPGDPIEIEVYAKWEKQGV